MAESAAPTAAAGGRLTDRTHAVLKLQLGDNGGIRRINFSRLWSPATQTVSYSKLVGLAREYSSSSAATTKADDDADVTITYVDEDGDTITISSDEELGEAFLQFVDKVPPVLRASATLKAKPEAKAEQHKEENQQKTEQNDQPKESPATTFVAPGDEHTGPTLRQPGSADGISGNTNGSPPEPIVEVLKGMASLLGSVVSSFNQQANANANNGNTANRSTPSVDPGTEEAERFVREVINNIQMAGSTSTPNTSSGATATTAPTDNVGLTGFDSTFIHGFHTCDGCKKKPIAGYRFHATNRPDYDLCMNCHADEAKCRDAEGVILFEPSELDRDRPNQLRWKAVRDSTKGADFMPSNTPEADGPCTHFIHGRHTCDGCLTTPIIGLRWHSTNLPDYDLCDRCKGNYKGEDIKFEAVELDRDRAFQTRWQRRQVRRARQARFAHARFAERNRCDKPMSSAQAAAAAAAASGRSASSSSEMTAPETKKGTDVMDVALKEAIRRSLADINVKGPNAPSKDVAECDEAKPAAAPEVEDTKPPEKMTVDPKVSQEPSGNLLALKPDLWKCTTCTILNDASDENCCACDEPKVAPSPKPAEAPSTPAEKKGADEDMVETPASAKTNFSEEAEGIGDVAEHLGATLDACAGFIDAIVTELDSKAAEKCPPENPSAPPMEEMDVPDSVSAMTSSIVSEDPREKNDETSNKKNEKVSDDINNGEEDQNEDDEWSMVSEQSDALAKATEAIGSALFDLDKKSSTDLAESGIDSIPSSVPTVSSSDAAPWAEELKKLHELGFTDDKASIGALQLLNKEAEAPVPIENIVEYLCATAETDDEADD